MPNDRLSAPPRAATKGLALLAVCAAAAAMPLTFTGTAVALPAIGRALQGGPVAMAWATNAFMLTFGSALMVAGALADSHGRKRVFLWGTLAFALFSLGLVVAPGMLVFDLLRGGQGLAAAAAYAGGAAALVQEFEGRARLRAFSVMGASFGAGLSLGPVASGLMVEAMGWRSIFLAVVALTGFAFLLGRVALTESRDPASGGLDRPGALAFTAMLALFTCGMLLVPAQGWRRAGAAPRCSGCSAGRCSAWRPSSRWSGGPGIPCWIFRFFATRASSACSCWQPHPPTVSSSCSSCCRCASWASRAWARWLRAS